MTATETPGHPTSTIFFSYAWENRPAALRIYDDLVRSGCNIWRDQIKGTFGVDFKEEISERIGDCDIFMLIDSPRARQSRWVGYECAFFTDCQRKSSHRKFVRCLIEKEAETQKYPELLPGLDRIKYYDFATNLLYDNDQSYRRSITTLCAFLGVTFHVLSDVPELHDLEDELFSFKIPEDIRKVLFNDFQAIQLWLRNGYADASLRARRLVEDLQFRQIRAGSPLLTLAITLSDAGQTDDACALFECYTRDFPFDPRGWRGLGGELFELGQFGEAAAAYSRAIQRTLDMARLPDLPPEEARQLSVYHQPRHAAWLEEARLNMAACLFRAENIKEATSLYEDIHRQPAGPTGHPNALYIGLADCYEALEEKTRNRRHAAAKREHILLEGLAAIPGDIRLNQDLGRLYIQASAFQKAIPVFTLVTTREPTDIPSWSWLLLCQKATGDRRGFSRHYAQAIIPVPADQRDSYARGFIELLAGHPEEAMEFYRRGGPGRPWYDDVLVGLGISSALLSP